MQVLDITGAPVLCVQCENVSSRTIGWLRDELQQRLPPTFTKPTTAAAGGGAPAEIPCEVILFQTYGEWIKDETKIREIQGQNTTSTQHTRTQEASGCIRMKKGSKGDVGS